MLDLVGAYVVFVLSGLSAVVVHAGQRSKHPVNGNDTLDAEPKNGNAVSK